MSSPSSGSPSCSSPAAPGRHSWDSFLLVCLELAKSNIFLSNYSRRHLRLSFILGVCRRYNVYMFVIIVYEMPALLRYLSNVQFTPEGGHL